MDAILDFSKRSRIPCRLASFSSRNLGTSPYKISHNLLGGIFARWTPLAAGLYVEAAFSKCDAIFRHHAVTAICDTCVAMSMGQRVTQSPDSKFYLASVLHIEDWFSPNVYYSIPLKLLTAVLSCSHSSIGI